MRARVYRAAEVARGDQTPLTNVPLFRHEAFSGCLLGLLPGRVLPRHALRQALLKRRGRALR